MLEYTKIGIQRYFQNKNCADVFMARPEYATTVKNRMKSAKRLIGLPATEAVIKHGLELIGMYINEYVSEIDFDEMKTMNEKYLGTDRINQLGIHLGFWERLMCLMDVSNAAIALVDEDQEYALQEFLSHQIHEQYQT